MGVFVYNVSNAAIITTNAVVNTLNDFAFLRPGAASRSARMVKIDLIGRGGSLTSISGIGVRINKWTTTASSASAVTPTPVDEIAPASQATAGMSATIVTSGTGGPTFLGTCGCGAAGPGGWVARDQDDGYELSAGDNRSVDLNDISATVSLTFECTYSFTE